MTRLSFSKLSRYETCPLSYKLHYIDRLERAAGVPLLFGSAVHAVLENLVREHMHEERVGPLPEDRAAALWQEAWAKSGMSGIDVFREGLDIVHRFVREQGVLEHHDVLAVEKEFRITIGGFEVIGYLDRVDRVDDEQPTRGTHHRVVRRSSSTGGTGGSCRRGHGRGGAPLVALLLLLALVDADLALAVGGIGSGLLLVAPVAVRMVLHGRLFKGLF